MFGFPTDQTRTYEVPNSAHRAKRVRQNAKRNALNNWRKRRIKESIRGFLKAVHDHDVDGAENAYRQTAGLLDKISSTSTMHKNTAARRKSRLARRLNELKAKSAGSAN